MLLVRGRYARKFIADSRALQPFIGPGPEENAIDTWTIAQDDAMSTFMQGYHPRAQSTIRKVFSRTLADKLKATRPDLDVASLVHETTHDALRQLRSDSADPIWGTLRNQPVESLAEFAKAMVTIQSMSSFVRGDGTVGGDVEIQVLTK